MAKIYDYRKATYAGYSWTENPVTGEQSAVNVRLYSKNLVDIKEKTSVDTGVFIPGIYRVNPYHVSRLLYRPSNVRLEDDIVSSNLRYKGVLDGEVGAAAIQSVKGSPAFTPPSSNLEERVVLNAFSKLGAAQVGAGENLGELRETLNLLRDPFGQLRRYLVSNNYRKLGLYNKLRHFLKTGRWGGLSGKHAADAAASAWLEFRYGLMPLVYTTQDIIKMVNKVGGKFDANRIHTKRSSLKSTTNGRKTGTSGADKIVFKYQGDVEHSQSAYAAVQYRMSEEQALARALGLTPEFWPELAWELTRLSFVVDWWLEVGKWLGAWRINPGINVLGYTSGLKTVSHAKVRVTQFKYNSSAADYKNSSADLGTVVREEYTRAVGTTPPGFPQFTRWNPLNLYRTIDSLALLLQSSLKLLRR